MGVSQHESGGLTLVAGTAAAESAASRPEDAMEPGMWGRWGVARGGGQGCSEKVFDVLAPAATAASAARNGSGRKRKREPMADDEEEDADGDDAYDAAECAALVYDATASRQAVTAYFSLAPLAALSLVVCTVRARERGRERARDGRTDGKERTHSLEIERERERER